MVCKGVEADSRLLMLSISATSLFGLERFSPLSPFSERAVLRRLSEFELSDISDRGRLIGRSDVANGGVGGVIPLSGGKATSEDILPSWNTPEDVGGVGI